MEYLKGKGIQTSIHYPAIHLFSFYKNLIVLETSLPITEEVARRELTLPLSPLMTAEDIEYIFNVLEVYDTQTPCIK